jgi:hypothetical protein
MWKSQKFGNVEMWESQICKLKISDFQISKFPNFQIYLAISGAMSGSPVNCCRIESSPV